MNTHTQRRSRRSGLIAAVMGTAAILLAAAPAGASVLQPAVVVDDPVNYTPNVQDDSVVANAYVYKLTPVNGTMYVGGSFNTVTSASRSTAYTRRNFFTFDEATGAVSALAPDFNGAIWAIEPSPDGKLFIGGAFTAVDGVSVNHLVKYDPTTNTVDAAFVPALGKYGMVTDLKMVNGRLLTSGSFAKKLLALDPATGKDTGYIRLDISGKVPNATAPTKVYRFAVSPDKSRLVGIGNFASVGGLPRYHAFVAALGATSATVTAWTSPRLDPSLHMCVNSEADFMRDVDYSPDGSYFVFATTGYRDPRDRQRPGALTMSSMCDTATRFESRDVSEDWTWVQRTGGDSLYSVAATGAAIYVGGHQRWLDNPYGEDYAGPGAVSRPGVGALDPASGKALAWNPTTSLGAGMREITVTDSGIWFGHDAKRFHNEWRWGISYCPLP